MEVGVRVGRFCMVKNCWELGAGPKRRFECGSSTQTSNQFGGSIAHRFVSVAFLLTMVLFANITAQKENVDSAMIAPIRIASAAASGHGRPAARVASPQCTRAFRGEDTLIFPEPFLAFTLCDVAGAIFPDFQPSNERSVAAGGTVRIDRAHRWDTSDRILLVVTYYVGEDAEVGTICGGCRVDPKIAVLERIGNTISIVARASVPGWDPYGMFNGRAEFDSASFTFQGKETLLALQTPWSYGMMGHTIRLDLFRLDDANLHLVFDGRIKWVAADEGPEDDVVTATIAPQPRSTGPNDILVKFVEARCYIEPTYTCEPGTPRGNQRWRFDGKDYKQIQGSSEPMPRLFHTRWGW